MRDLAILCILLGFIYLAFYRPWLGVIGLTVFAYMQPHTYASGFIVHLPVYKILFVAVAISAGIALFRTNDWQWPPWDWRVAAFLLLWAWFLLTTFTALLPWAAWPKFIEISKIFAPLILTLLFINTREKLFYLIVAISASIALVTLKGGYWAVMTGFSNRVYGPPGSHYYDNNAFAVLVIMNIPLLVLWLRETRDRWLRYALMGMIALSVAAALSSWSRGALLALGVTALFLLWDSRRKYLAVLFLASGVGLAVVNLPEGWFERMETIAQYEQEGSAQGRLEIWKIGINAALQHPLTGTGFDGWRLVAIGTEHRRDWHSIYVEILAEHGFVGFALWSSLLFGGIVGLTRLTRTGKPEAEAHWVANYSALLRASLIAYAVGGAFLGISYWDIFYHLIFLSILTRKFAMETAAAPVANPDRALDAVLSSKRAQASKRITIFKAF